MLLSFTVSNFRSFRDEQVFSLVASSAVRSRHSRYLIETGVRTVPDALPVAVIFGPNASGKSNLTYAFLCLRYLVCESRRRNPDDSLQFDHYKLGEKYNKEPSKFEIVFCHMGTKWEYVISANDERVTEEYLYSRELKSGKRNRCVFERSWNYEKNDYEWFISDSVKGRKESWIDSCHKSASFLATSVQLNSDSLKVPYDWIESGFEVSRVPNQFFSLSDVDDNKKPLFLDFLNLFDLGIYDYTVDHTDIKDHLSKEFQEAFSKLSDGDDGIFRKMEVKMFHETEEEGKVIALDLDDESTGTIGLFNLAGPIISSLMNGICLIIDELNTSLHPHALRQIVRIFQDPTINSNGAQLVFTTHDTSILTENLLDRDQVWIMERKAHKYSILTPLTEFQPRTEDALQRRYLSGRYGGVPFLSNQARRRLSQKLLAFGRETHSSEGNNGET